MLQLRSETTATRTETFILAWNKRAKTHMKVSKLFKQCKLLLNAAGLTWIKLFRLMRDDEVWQTQRFFVFRCIDSPRVRLIYSLKFEIHFSAL